MTDSLTLFNPEALSHLEKMAKTLSQSSLIPDALKGKPGDVLVTLMTGAELGLQPMQALRSIAVVKGKPSLSADLMVSLVKQRKDVCEYLILVKSTPEVATYKAKRVGEPEPTEMSFTMLDAQRAGLTGAGGMYAKYPAQMLRARCASGICRAVFPDLCMGLYDSDSGELTDGKPPPEKDVTPPKRGLEAIPSVKAPEPPRPGSITIVDESVVPDEELRAKRAQAPMKTLPPPTTLQEKEARADLLRDALAKNPKAKNRKTVEAALGTLEREIAELKAVASPVSDVPPPTDADFTPSDLFEEPGVGG